MIRLVLKNGCRVQIVVALPVVGLVAAFNEALAASMLTMVTLRGVSVDDAKVLQLQLLCLTLARSVCLRAEANALCVAWAGSGAGGIRGYIATGVPRGAHMRSRARSLAARVHTLPCHFSRAAAVGARAPRIHAALRLFHPLRQAGRLRAHRSPDEGGWVGATGSVSLIWRPAAGPSNGRHD